MTITFASQSSPSKLFFNKLSVADVYRRQINGLSPTSSIDDAIRIFIKYKLDAVVVLSGDHLPAGIITKTETTGAFYGEMALETPLQDIMGSPVLSCKREDSLESALLSMQSSGVNRLYVTDDQGRAIGSLSYPDILGILYRHCYNCPHSLSRRGLVDGNLLRYSIGDGMRRDIVQCDLQDSISYIIESVIAAKQGAVLIMGDEKALGVITKTNLSLAYLRGISLDQPAVTIMHSPVHSCDVNQPLEQGIRSMILAEISRLFICEPPNDKIIGSLNLADAAMLRSGSCKACSNSRIQVKD